MISSAEKGYSFPLPEVQAECDVFGWIISERPDQNEAERRKILHRLDPKNPMAV